MKNLTRLLIQPIKLLASCIGIFLLSSCAKQYAVSSNVDGKNFSEYFSPSEVTIYENEQSISEKFKLIGIIEGEDCQLKPHFAAPDPIIARTNARRKAFEQGANGIIFTGCTEIKSKACIAQLVCIGKIYQVEKPKS